MALLLRELFEQVITEASKDPEGCCLPEAEFYAKLDCFGTSNPHLVNSTRHPEAGWALRREKPLTGLEPVHGDYLLFVYCSHDPFVHLREHDSVASIETALLSIGGVFNPFLTYLVAFVHGRAAPYRISYRDAEGKRAVYSPYSLDEVPITELDAHYPDRRVDWLG